jgi:hypothetical protein
VVRKKEEKSFYAYDFYDEMLERKILSEIMLLELSREEKFACWVY